MEILIGTSLGAVDDEQEMKYNPLRDNIPPGSRPRAAPEKGKLQRAGQFQQNETENVKELR